MWATPLAAGAVLQSYTVRHRPSSPKEQDPTSWRLEVRGRADGWRTVDTVSADEYY
eukprot:gene26188-52638_t